MSGLSIIGANVAVRRRHLRFTADCDGSGLVCGDTVDAINAQMDFVFAFTCVSVRGFASSDGDAVAKIPEIIDCGNTVRPQSGRETNSFAHLGLRGGIHGD